MAEGNGLSPQPGRFLLDTNIVLALIRDNPLGRWIDATYRLSEPGTQALVSIVTVGELMSFAYRGNWGEEKRTRYEGLLQELVWIDINDLKVLEAYAGIDSSFTAKGRNFTKNDLWIAACARATGAILLTTDTDFNHLQGTWIDLNWIDPNMGKTP